MPKKVGENEMDIFKIFKGKKNTKEPIPEKEPQRIYPNLEQNLTRSYAQSQENIDKVKDAMTSFNAESAVMNENLK